MLQENWKDFKSYLWPSVILEMRIRYASQKIIWVERILCYVKKVSTILDIPTLYVDIFLNWPTKIQAQ